MKNKQEEKLTKRYTYTEYLETFVHPDCWGEWYKDSLGEWHRKEKPGTITITTASTQEINQYGTFNLIWDCHGRMGAY